MRTTAISDDGCSIRIERNGNNRMILKSHIKEISIIKNTVLHIDLGDDRRIFIPCSEISNPNVSEPVALLSILSNWVDSVANARFVEVSGKLDEIKTNIGGNQNNYTRPQITDTNTPNIIYNGFCNTDELHFEEASWNVERMTHADGIMTRQWADGSTDYSHIWNERETYLYK
jgi:hypothetical protein